MGKKKGKEPNLVWDNEDGNIIGKLVMPSDDELRTHGYMTANEFVEKFTHGLREYLRMNWTKDPEAVHHPEDLAANASAFAEATMISISAFGVKNTNE